MKKLVAALFVITLAACGPSTEKDEDPIVINNGGENAVTNANPNSTTTTNNTPDPASRAGQIRNGLAIPDAAYDAGTGSLNLAAEAVFLASQLGAAGEFLVTSGTLTQQGNTLNFDYSESPANKLVVAWSEGPSTDFVITAFDGDFSGDASQFIGNDHVVQFQATRDGIFDINVNSQRSNGQSSASLSGSMTVEGVTYTLNLQLGGTYSSSVEITSNSYESSEQFLGEISGSDGFAATINETHDFKLVNSVTNRDRTANNTWTADGNEYTLQGLRIRYETRDGWANPSDFWIAEGSVLENGNVVGQVSYEQTSAWISIFILVDGEQIELERFMLQQ